MRDWILLLLCGLAAVVAMAVYGDAEGPPPGAPCDADRPCERDPGAADSIPPTPLDPPSLDGGGGSC